MAMLNNQRVSEYEQVSGKLKKTSYTMNGMIFHIAKLNMGKSRWAILKGHSVHYELVPSVLVIGNQFDNFDSLFFPEKYFVKIGTQLSNVVNLFVVEYR